MFLVANVATASLVTYHVTGDTETSALGVPGATLTLEFTIDDATPASFDNGTHAEYIGSVVGGFVRVGATIFNFSGSGNVVILNDDGDPASDLIDLFQFLVFIEPGASLPGLGEAEFLIFLMATLAPGPTPPLSSVALTQVIPPASAFGGANIVMQFLQGDQFSTIVHAGPLPGPAGVPEPATLMLLLAALPALVRYSRRRDARDQK